MAAKSVPVAAKFGCLKKIYQMREEIYTALVARISEQVPEVQHIDLWNEQVAFVEDEMPYDRPAVFIQFMPISWEPMIARPAARGEARIRLHVVTDWHPEAADKFLSLRLCDKVARAVNGLSGDSFSALDMTTSATNHNHEELVENIEEFTYRCTRSLSSL